MSVNLGCRQATVRVRSKRAGAITLLAVSLVAAVSTFVAPSAAEGTPPGPGLAEDAAKPSPEGITVGPDGALWVANSAGDSISRTSAGATTTYPLPAGTSPRSIVAGGDGALWFTGYGTPSTGVAGSIGRITTAGGVKQYFDASIVRPEGITVGLDGALWFTNYVGNSIGRITTGGVVTNFTAPSVSSPAFIVPGPDGALWFTNGSGNSIGRITTGGTITNFPAPGVAGPRGIAVGADGALWFSGVLSNTIGRITTAGVVTTFTDPTLNKPYAMVRGSDGAMWFTNVGGQSISRITRSGVITTFTDPSVGTPAGITAGPGGKVYFTDRSASTSAGAIRNFTIPAPGNDAFANAATLSGRTVSRVDDHNVNANRETGEPSPATISSGSSVWYSWTAPSSAPVTIDTTGSNFDTVLGVYTGSAVNALVPVVSNDNNPGCSPCATSRVDFNPTAGTTYRIAVAGALRFPFGTSTGWIWFKLSSPAPTVPNAPTAASAVPGDGEAFVGWEAPASDGYQPITNYVVTPYIGAAPQTSTFLGPSNRSAVIPGLANGTTYTFKVAAANSLGTGPASLATGPVTPVSSVPDPPFNDDFASAADLYVDAYTFVATNVGATTEPGEPTPLGYGSGKSVWATFSRSDAGRLTIDTCGTTFDTLMAVYTGSSLAALAPVAENDEGDCGYGPSKLTFDVAPGVVYWIQVASYDPDGPGPIEPPDGYINFTWRFQTPPSAPTAVSAVGGFGSATVTWDAPEDGGAAVTGYVVTPYIGATPQPSVTFNDTATTHDVPVPLGAIAYTFKVAAKNAVGTGANSTASNAVNVKFPFAPFSSWSAYVDRLYKDITNKAPTTAERNAATSALQGGTKTVGQVAESLRRGTENTTNVDPIARLYRAFLGRTPDAGGFKFWLARRRTGTWTLTRTADYFATSNEFKTKYGALTNRQFVTRIYTDVLGRTADTSGVNYWTKKLDTKSRTRGGVMVGFSESSEYKRKQLENTDAAMAYIFLLGRAPKADEAAGFADTEKADPAQHDDLLTVLLRSSAYQSHITG